MDIKNKLLKLLERRVFNAEELVEEIDKLYKQDQALQLQQTGVVWQSEQFYCNQDDGEYNNNPCSKQCNFCKEAESFK